VWDDRLQKGKGAQRFGELTKGGGDNCRKVFENKYIPRLLEVMQLATVGPQRVVGHCYSGT